MAWQEYRVQRFAGINQSVSQNLLDSGESPDARNMDTSGGRLSVARGYVRASDAALASPGDFDRLYVWSRDGGRIFVAAGAGGISVLPENAAAWRGIHSYAAGARGTGLDFQNLKLASTEYLVAADGASQPVKWDGGAETEAAPFGSAEALSDRPVAYLELYYSRLFAAGDPAYPCRLYWSCAPGDARTPEDWSSVAEGENVSGGHVEIGTDSDPITGLFSLSNQLLIFKRDSLYRLLGDRPSNYRICPLGAAMRGPSHTACVRYGDVLYFLTEAGLYYFDGQNVRRSPDADKVKDFLAAADLSDCRAAACGDRLYFALKTGAAAAANDALLVYDLVRGSYMIRDGFTARGLCAYGGRLYILDGAGRVCRFEEGESYDGARIDAYWYTPLTDLDSKIAVKQLKELYLRGSGGLLGVSAETGGREAYYERVMPEPDGSVLEAPLTALGRSFRLKLENVGGSRFTVDGGLELLLDLRRRAL
ncbi:MAG: hypothetical protein Q4C13_03150 [Clostridia bacterium]|nr:hypothetical protein [Clostridia bacterium]